MSLQQGTTTYWIKSSHSGGNGACVEVSSPARGAVGVRDSKVPGGPRLSFRPEAWTDFVAAVRGAEARGH